MTHNSIAAATPRDLVLGSLAGFVSGIEGTGPGIWLGASFTDTARANGFTQAELLDATLEVATERGLTEVADRVQQQIEFEAARTAVAEAVEAAELTLF